MHQTTDEKRHTASPEQPCRGARQLRRRHGKQNDWNCLGVVAVCPHATQKSLVAPIEELDARACAPVTHHHGERNLQHDEYSDEKSGDRDADHFRSLELAAFSAAEEIPSRAPSRLAPMDSFGTLSALLTFSTLFGTTMLDTRARSSPGPPALGMASLEPAFCRVAPDRPYSGVLRRAPDPRADMGATCLHCPFRAAFRRSAVSPRTSLSGLPALPLATAAPRQIAPRPEAAEGSVAETAGLLLHVARRAMPPRRHRLRPTPVPASHVRLASLSVARRYGRGWLPFPDGSRRE
jgi:hypothetical protein